MNYISLENKNSNNEKKRFQELDALRGIAAVLVVFFHFTVGKNGYDRYFKIGITGVDLFFIISGFVIFMSLQHINNSIDFVINRVSRLYPTYWASVSFTFFLFTVYAIYKHTFSYKDIIIYMGNLTMFQYYLNIPDLDGPYWTMIIEMVFYISILLLFQFKLLKYLNIIYVITCVTTVILTRFFWTSEWVRLLLKWIPLLQFLPLFFAGTIFYNLYTDSGNTKKNYILILFCMICQLLLFPYVGRSSVILSQYAYSIILTVYFLLFVLFVNRKLGFIVNRTTLFFGKISFALYLIHQYISLGFIIPSFHNQMHINFWVTCCLIDLPIIVAIATLITYKIDIPYSKKMKEKLRKLTNSRTQESINTL